MITANIRAQFGVQQIGPVHGGSLGFNVAIDLSMVFTNGHGANQANRVWSQERTIGTDADDDIDLMDDMTDALGNPVNMETIVGFLVAAHPNNAGDIVVGGHEDGVTLLGGGQITLPPGACIMLASRGGGLATLADGDSDILRVTNPHVEETATYTVAVLGRLD